MGLVHILACLLEPYMPSFSNEVIQLVCRYVFELPYFYFNRVLYCSDVLWWPLKVFKQLNLEPENHRSLSDEKDEINRAKRPWEIIPPGHKIGTPVPLFKELVFPYDLSYWCYFYFLSWSPFYVFVLGGTDLFG